MDALQTHRDGMGSSFQLILVCFLFLFCFHFLKPKLCELRACLFGFSNLVFCGYVMCALLHHHRDEFFSTVESGIFKICVLIKFRQKMDSKTHPKSLMTSLPLWCKTRVLLTYPRGLKDWLSSQAFLALTLLTTGCVITACCVYKIPTIRAIGMCLGNVGNKGR